MSSETGHTETGHAETNHTKLDMQYVTSRQITANNDVLDKSLLKNMIHDVENQRSGDHEIHSDESTKSAKWSCHDGIISKSLVIFIAQFLLSISVVIVSIVKLFTGSVDERTLYISLLTGTVSLYMPSPMISKKNNQG